jgi:ABC-type molybdate transport system substrate-binding protein
MGLLGIALIGLSPLPAFAAQDSGDGSAEDIRTFSRDGSVQMGRVEDSYTADLVMYLAGNQFMVMQELMGDFFKTNADINTVFVETIPPGQIVAEQLLKQGSVNGKNIAMNPDIYASTDVAHVVKLKAAGKMDDYMTYIRNRLALMVAPGNPKNIRGPQDLTRTDLVQSHPNPVTEGIFKNYGAEMLKDLGIYEQVTGNQQCRSCWAVPGKTWFTSRHHRETPERIENGEADVGIVWSTEVAHAKASGRKVDGIEIAPPLNKQDKAGYVIGVYKDGRNLDNARVFLAYLATDRAQSIYEKYGFSKASTADLKVASIPASP